MNEKERGEVDLAYRYISLARDMFEGLGCHRFLTRVYVCVGWGGGSKCIFHFQIPGFCLCFN